VDDELIGMTSVSTADKSLELRRVCLLGGWLCDLAPNGMACGSIDQRNPLDPPHGTYLQSPAPHQHPYHPR